MPAVDRRLAHGDPALPPKCRRCERPVSDATVCSACAGVLARALGDVSWLAGELVTSFARLGRSGGQVGGRSAERAVPWDERAARAGGHLRSTLVSWCLLVAEERPAVAPADTLPAMAGWLLGQVEWLRHHMAAGDAVEQIDRAVADARRVVDSRPERWFVGTCGAQTESGPCPVWLYVEVAVVEAPGRKPRSVVPDFVTCSACKTSWDVGQRRSWLLDAAWDTLAHAELIGRAAPALGVDITPSAVRGYAERGRIAAHSVDGEGRPLYKVGEVIEVAQQIMAERARRGTKRERKTA